MRGRVRRHAGIGRNIRPGAGSEHAPAEKGEEDGKRAASHAISIAPEVPVRGGQALGEQRDEKAETSLAAPSATPVLKRERNCRGIAIC